MDKQKALISLDVAAARDASRARIKLLKVGYVQAAKSALAARVANMLSARKNAGQLEKAESLAAKLVQIHKG